MVFKLCKFLSLFYVSSLPSKMSSIFRTMSRRSTDSQDIVVNSEEINYPKIQNDLDDWKLPKVSNQEIYKKGTFKFFTDYTIKTYEMSVSDSCLVGYFNKKCL